MKLVIEEEWIERFYNENIISGRQGFDDGMQFAFQQIVNNAIPFSEEIKSILNQCFNDFACRFDENQKDEYISQLLKNIKK